MTSACIKPVLCTDIELTRPEPPLARFQSVDNLAQLQFSIYASMNGLKSHNRTLIIPGEVTDTFGLLEDITES